MQHVEIWQHPGVFSVRRHYCSGGEQMVQLEMECEVSHYPVVKL